jgi:dTDP-4-dehydrorhamnose 3,5-epimerase
MPFHFQRLRIPDVILVRPDRFEDDRGFFAELYKRSAFSAAGISPPFVQCNYSHSREGVLRGLHYQKHAQAQGKLVMAIRGRIFDVAVDIREGSPTYGDWVGETLSSDDGRMLYIPPGFAHGFCVVSPEADVIYHVTEEYAPELDRGIIWNDPHINVRWPIPDPVLSPKDAHLPPLREADNNFVYRPEEGSA